MNIHRSRLCTTLLIGAAVCASLAGQGGRRNQITPDAGMTLVLGRPTDRSIALSVLAPTPLEVFVEFGAAPGKYTAKSATSKAAAGDPFELAIAPLQPNTRYYYRLRHRQPGQLEFDSAAEQSFQTQRATGSTFAFGVQGDSHPERPGKMFDPSLYTRTLERVREERPDFYLMLGDDFSIEQLIARATLSQNSVNQVYARQRAFLGRLAAATPLFLANGNHEEAARFLLDGTPSNPAVFAGKARTAFFPLPAPDAFYSGDTEIVDSVGLLRDYYAWTWGDALFVVIDPYWHSPVQVDEDPGGRRGAADAPRRTRDLWTVTLGDAQYTWLKQTLEGSRARYKFVFSHHVMGTGRGAIELADFFEWGGNDRRGSDRPGSDGRGANQFRERRPTWELPIHQLMAKTGVTIFFQGHDHLFAHQQKDGVTYQETPNPADDTYTAFNRDAYRSGDILPNSGHLRVTVSPANVRVDYIRSYLSKDETPRQKDGEVAFSYTIAPVKPAR